ncbi:MAG TPA: toll/interleukin-1 receptor domain-containing protein [Thermoanaerobaculia bacterium]|nr:toll/interleukin-1 receptor domain-containing protein [Thermoanaerobaculia bacterium]
MTHSQLAVMPTGGGVARTGSFGTPDKLAGIPNQEAALSETFDVFLSHNSKDKPTVRQIGEALRNRGFKVWLDEWELVPGRPWQEAVEEIIGTVRSSAVLVGKDGLGPWENPEMRACLTQMVRRKLPVIPVLLPGCPQAPELPLFLVEVTWVDLRAGLIEDGLDSLEWGITGKKPNREKKGPRPHHGPKIHNLPFLPLGDLLKGRDEELRTLETNLHGPAAATAITQTHAIHGLGGIGKTRLAVEYAWRSGTHYDATLFVMAESPEALQSGLAGLTRRGLPGLIPVPSHAQEEEVAAVLAWLREHDRWLLILDNVDTPEAATAVEDLLPPLTTGHVLVTSRRREWSAGIQKQPLGALSSEEAVQFLLQRTDGERAKSPADPGQAKRLAEILDGLPLALSQVAAYIVHHQISFKSYLEDWETQRGTVLSYYDKSVMRYPASVAVTWQTTFNKLHPTAAAILRLTAYLAPDPIPLEMFEKEASIVEEAVGLLLKETGQEAAPQKVRDGLTELAEYSLLTKDGETGTVHRMVQEVVRGWIPEEQRREWIERAVRLVDDFSPPKPGDVRTWPVWNVLRPHAAVVVKYADEAQIARPTARLMNELEQFLKAKGLYAEAEPLIRRSLTIEEEIDPDSHKVARRLNNLATLLQTTNRLAEAEPLMRRVVEIFEASIDPNHSDVATALNNLAQLLQDTNRLAEAETLMRRALKIDEDLFGQGRPEVAIGLNNLATLLQDTNRLAEAEKLMRRALKIDEDSFGQDHPDVAIDLINLGALLQATNRSTEAEQLFWRALKILEDSLGPDHPSTQNARAWLAD